MFPLLFPTAPPAHPFPPVGGVGCRPLHADDARLARQAEAGDGAVAGQLQHVAPLHLAVDVVRVDPQPREQVRRLRLTGGGGRGEDCIIVATRRVRKMSLEDDRWTCVSV